MERRPPLSGDKLKEFEPLFFPKSIAVVGVATDPSKSGSMYFDGLLRANFKGKAYAVGLDEGEAGGHRIFHSLLDIPDEVDYVIVAISREGVIRVLDDCVAKRVKAGQTSGSGFSSWLCRRREAQARKTA